MSSQPTHLLNQTLALGDDPDHIEFEVHDGHGFLFLGRVAIALGQSSQAALDKLATATAAAAADHRNRTLREVA
jgi:hypothetical protein